MPSCRLGSAHFVGRHPALDASLLLSLPLCSWKIWMSTPWPAWLTRHGCSGPARGQVGLNYLALLSTNQALLTQPDVHSMPHCMPLALITEGVLATPFIACPADALHQAEAAGFEDRDGWYWVRTAGSDPGKPAPGKECTFVWCPAEAVLLRGQNVRVHAGNAHWARTG